MIPRAPRRYTRIVVDSAFVIYIAVCAAVSLVPLW